jgi:L-fucose mutarotase
MLKNINPLLTPELLYVMAAMGHGDELAVVDANFPAYSVARGTTNTRVVPMAGVSLPEAVSAMLSLLPLDEFVDSPVRSMAGGAAGRHWPIGELERFAFYEAARTSYAVVLTGERRFYGNVLIKKGALAPQD